MKINTKVVFEWNPESKQYEEIYCDSYDYDGEVDQCQYDPYSTFKAGFPSADIWGGSQPSQQFDFQAVGASMSPLANVGRPFMSLFSGDEDLGLEDVATSALSKGFDYSSFEPSLFKTTAQKIGAKYGALPGAGPKAVAGAPWEFASVNRCIGQMKPFGAKGIVQGQRKTSALGTGTLGQTKPSYSDLLQHPSEKEYSKGLLGTTAAKEEASSIFGRAASIFGSAGGMMAAGALFGGISGYGQAKSQKKGLAAAIGELDPIKTQALGAYKRSLGLAESYRPGGKYSRYMGGKILSQAEESVGQETSRMIASGITSPSMMRQIGHQSRRQAEASLPGMEMQVSQMALPYEQLASGYFGQYRGLGEQLAGLRGAKKAVNPWASAISGAMGGAMGMGSMFSSLA